MTLRRICLHILLAGSAFAQEYRAAIRGRISDPGGAAVAAASIEIISDSQGPVGKAVSNDAGAYELPFIAPGRYTMTIEKAGFTKLVRPGLTLDVAERAILDFTLALGDVHETVVIHADAPLLQTANADRGMTVQPDTISQTPLQGRNIFAEAWSAPGVAVASSVTRLRPFDISGSSSIAISGGQSSMNEVLIDGVSDLSRATAVAFVPPVEGTAEFRVQTSAYDAQYGWTTGGVINIITKSGGNDWHGSVFEYVQNTLLNANTFNSNRLGVPRQSSHINTFGGDLGGPIIHDHLFFAFAYENIRQVAPSPFVASVPTATQRTGDFSTTYYGMGSTDTPLVQTIYNPFSTHVLPDGTLARDPFAGNKIPAAVMNPVAVKVLSLVPHGNTLGDPLTGLNNLVANSSTRKFTDFFPEYTGRADYNLDLKTRLFVRYSRNALTEERGFHYSTVAAINVAETTFNAPFTRENHNATVQITRTLTATAVFNLRLGLSRFLSQSGSAIGADYNLASLGFSPEYRSEAKAWFPRFNWANYDGAGSYPSQFDPKAQTNTFQGGVSLVRGRQSLTIGGEFRLQRAYRTNPGYWAGDFSFDQQFTGQNPLSIQPSSGNAIASFLLGTPASGLIDVNTEPALQQRLWSAFLQDDVRLSQRLSFNLGLRYDYLGPLTDRFNALTRGFDTTTPSPLQVPGLALKGGLLFAGVNGQNRGIFNPQWHNVGPRIGAAYQMTSRTVLRGGYALLYAQTFDDPGPAPGFSQETALVTSIEAGVPLNLVTNPFPTGILHPAGSSLGLATALGQSYSFADPDRPIPYVHQFSFEIQHELAHNALLSLAYVGSRIRHLEVTKAINEISAQSMALGASALALSVPNPMAGLVPGTSLNGPSIQEQQLLRPFPQFLSINELDIPIGRSSYNALQALVEKRLSSGLNLSVAYTLSKTLDRTGFRNPQDTALEKAAAPWDVTNSIQMNGAYELPFGLRKRYGASSPRVFRTAISGWKIATIARLQSGMPLSLTPYDAVPTGVSPAAPHQTLSQWFNTCTLLLSGATHNCQPGEAPAWTVRPPATLQSWSSNITSVRNPSIENLDLSVMKDTRLSERAVLVIRGDLLNATNTPQFFNGPITDINNPNFGRIAGAMDQSNLPRFLQLSVKLKF
jgi:hypothetical protein